MVKQLTNVLTIEELASYLKIPKSTLYKLVREGKIPAQKIGRHWRFWKGAIDGWLEDLPMTKSISKLGVQTKKSGSGVNR